MTKKDKFGAPDSRRRDSDAQNNSVRAEAMAVPALEAFAQKKFEDTAYFEPFYLKQFVATVSRKNLF